MPIIDEKAPTVGDFDALLEMLRVADDNTACVFNCQVNMFFFTCAMYFKRQFFAFPKLNS